MHLALYLVPPVGALVVIVIAICRVRDPDRIRIGIGSRIFLDVSRTKTDEATPLPGLPDASSAHTLPTRRSSARRIRTRGHRGGDAY